ALHSLQRLEGLQMDMHLALVVSGSSAEQISVANGGIKRRRGPELQRFRGLHVVMAVKKNRCLARGLEGFGIDQWMKVRWHHFNGLESGGAQLVGHPAGRSF